MVDDFFPRERSNHRKIDHRNFKFFVLGGFASLPTAIAILVPYLLPVECIAIARDFDMGSQLGHVGGGGDFTLQQNILLLGIGVEWIHYKLGVHHLGVHKKNHNCLSKFIKGFFALEENHKLQDNAGMGVNKCVQEGG